MEAKDPAQHTAAPTPGRRIIANEVDTIVFRWAEASSNSFLPILVDDPQEVERRVRQPVELSYHQHVACLDGDYFSMIQTPFHSSAGGSA
jgi:hypothetical protein